MIALPLWPRRRTHCCGTIEKVYPPETKGLSMKLRFFSFAFIVTVIIAVPLIADTVVEEIVARVNSEIITRSEFQRSRNQLLNESKDKYGAQVDPTTKEKDVLRDLIDQA